MSLYAWAKTKAQVTAQLISVFVFATQIVQPLLCLNVKIRAASQLLYITVQVHLVGTSNCWVDGYTTNLLSYGLSPLCKRWEITAHRRTTTCFLYMYLIVSLVIPDSIFGVGFFFWLPIFLIVAYSYECLSAYTVIEDFLWQQFMMWRLHRGDKPYSVTFSSPPTTD